MRDTWNAIVSLLRETSYLFGTDAHHVRRGRFGESTLRAPFVLVYLTPGRSAAAAENGHAAGHLAYTLDVFVGIEPGTDASDAACTATERASQIAGVLSAAGSFSVVFDDDPITLDTVTNAFTAVRLGATIYP